MTLTRKAWKAIGELVLIVAGPTYADSLRAKAAQSTDPGESRRLSNRAAMVDALVSDPKETVDGVERLHDAVFGRPKPRRRKGSRRT
jgi:hypothetical protein